MHADEHIKTVLPSNLHKPAVEGRAKKAGVTTNFKAMCERNREIEHTLDFKSIDLEEYDRDYAGSRYGD